MIRVHLFTNPDALIQRFIKKEMYLHFAATMSRPNALIYAVARVFQNKNPNFTVSMAGMHSSGHALTIAKVIKKLITGFAGDNYPRPIPNRMYSKILEGQPYEVELWSLLSFVQRFMAGALKLPGFITNSLIGSDMVHDKLGKTLFEFDNPKKLGEKLAMVTPLNPDITFVHGVCADRNGNIMLAAPYGEGIWSALAAKKGVLASVERIVPAGAIPPELIHIPGSRVLGVCEIPFGAHPQSLRVKKNILNQVKGLSDLVTYRDDYEFIIEANSVGESDLQADVWFLYWVNLVGGYDTYIDLLGEDRLEELTEPPDFQKMAARRGIIVEQDTSDCNETEQMIILTARAITDLVKKNKYKTILAGIGAAHMAAWTAAFFLEDEDIPIKIISEMGFYGTTPYPGDVFLFSQMHADTTEQLSDVTQILGSLVPRDCLGVLGTAEIDIDGNINSTRLPNGKFLVGSGGANDIASTADCIVVAKALKSRFTKKVNFITSPGKNVKQVLCQFGRFTRGKDKNFYLSHWRPPITDPDITPKEAIQNYTSWNLEYKDPVFEKPVTPKELGILRKLDPQKIFISGKS
ncbi:MAG: 3-oxoacid CoA-transferase [Leptospiraceae bacterium]|nr:3-oxoacid CoA-transferase [Leptospiraceae bacterium]MCP5513190.1 3-oxoacid CoA-transferase [Leptospiraceae bacterium]